ncbi:MAG: hypothetical protein ACXWID_15155 [Pyrinomonadaceae bacterium]
MNWTPDKNDWSSDKVKALLDQWKRQNTALLVAVFGFGFKVSAWGIVTDLLNDSLKIALTNGGEISFDVLGASFSYDEIPPDVQAASQNTATHALQINFPDRMLVLSEWHGVVP